MSDPASEPAAFVSVMEASRRLGIDPRQVRRYMERLESPDLCPDGDRTYKGRPVLLVRLAALIALRDAADKATDEESGHIQSGHSDRAESKSGRPKPGPDPVSESWRERAAVAEAKVELLERENARQAALLERTTATADRLSAQIAADRQQYAVLIAAASAGRIEAPKRGDREDREDREDTEPTMPTPTDPNENTTGPKAEESQSAPHEEAHHDAHTQSGRRFVTQSEQEAVQNARDARDAWEDAQEAAGGPEDAPSALHAFAPVGAREPVAEATPRRSWWARLWGRG